MSKYTPGNTGFAEGTINEKEPTTVRGELQQLNAVVTKLHDAVNSIHAKLLDPCSGPAGPQGPKGTTLDKPIDSIIDTIRVEADRISKATEVLAGISSELNRL